MMLFKSYFEHLASVVATNKEIKVGLGSSATGAVSYEVGQVAAVNTVWDMLAHVLLILSILGTLFALFRGWYSFRKEWKKDRLEQLRLQKKILKIEGEINGEIEV